MKGPRHTTIDKDALAASRQNSENARDTLEALGAKLTGQIVVVQRYTATGSTSSKIRIGVGNMRPALVMLGRAVNAYDGGASVAVTGNANFIPLAGTNTIDVFEPTGLVANTVYTLTFLVVEA